MRSADVLVVLCATLLGSGCAGSAAGPAPATAPATASATPSSSAGVSTVPAGPARTVTITVTGSAVSPAPAVVEVGRDQTLRLVVTSDHDDSLHAHGFEVEKDLTAGVPLTLDLRGAEPGRYEVETHHRALQLLVVQVR